MANLYVIAGQSNAERLDASIRAEILKKDPSAVFLSSASAGAPLTWSRSGADWRQSGELRDILPDQIISSLRAQTGLSLKSLIWIQGEADALNVGRAINYQEDLSALFSHIAARISAALPDRSQYDRDFDILGLRLSDRAPGIGIRENWSTVQREMDSFDAARSDALFLNPDRIADRAGLSASSMFRDDLHYSTAMATEIAKSVAAAVVPAPPAPLTQGTAGADRISLSSRSESLNGFSGDDTLYGNGGRDTLHGSSGNDVLHGGADVDLLYGGDGNDALYGYGGSDRFAGGNGSDRLFGGAGNDHVSGEAGNDLLSGAAGDDFLFGGTGFDTLDGGLGRDHLYGGFGRDTFVHYGPGHGTDLIYDFNGQEDLLVLQDGSPRSDISVRTSTLPGVGTAAGDIVISDRTTGQDLWILVDAAGTSVVNLRLGADIFDLI